MNKAQHNLNFRTAHPEKYQANKKKHDKRVWCYVDKEMVRLGHFGEYPDHFETIKQDKKLQKYLQENYLEAQATGN